MTATAIASPPAARPPVESANAAKRHSLLARMLSPAPDFNLCFPDDGSRHEVEAFIHQRFESSYGASLNEYFPALLAMRCFDQLSGVAGIRSAANHRLFLEKYLDAAIEDVMSAVLQRKIKRQDVIEIGNLVSTQRGASHLLFLIFTTVLYQAGYQWITFTATRALRNNLDKLGFSFIRLAGASPDALDNESLQQWGDYYSTQPQVLVGSLADAADIIRSRPLFRRVSRLYHHKMNYLSKELEAARHV